VITAPQALASYDYHQLSINPLTKQGGCRGPQKIEDLKGMV